MVLPTFGVQVVAFYLLKQHMTQVYIVTPRLKAYRVIASPRD